MYVTLNTHIHVSSLQRYQVRLYDTGWFISTKLKRKKKNTSVVIRKSFSKKKKKFNNSIYGKYRITTRVVVNTKILIFDGIILHRSFVVEAKRLVSRKSQYGYFC